MDHDFGTPPTGRDDLRRSHLNGPHQEQNSSNRNNDQRPTISVVIDEDEEIDEEGNNLDSSFMSNETEQDRDNIPQQDHNYTSRAQNIESKNSDTKFPVIGGLEINHMDEFSSENQTLTKARPMPRQSIKRMSNYYGEYESGDGYYQQQIKVQPRYISVANVHQSYQPSLGQRQQRKSDGLALNLRPTGRGRQLSTSLDSCTTVVRTTHSLPPPIAQQHHQMNTDEHGDLSPFFDEPAPMITARGRPTGAKNKNREENLRTSYSYGRDGRMLPTGYTASPPIANASHFERQRNSQRLTKHKNVQNQREPEQQMGLEQQLSPTLDEEQRLNDLIYAQQKKRMTMQQGGNTKRQRSPRKSTIPPADSIQSIDFDPAKPPDDPFSPSEPRTQRTILVESRQRRPFDESSVEDTINAVVRGEASVMQQHFGPPSVPINTMMAQHYHQQQMNPAYKLSQNATQIIQTQRKEEFDQSPRKLMHQRLDDLAELAHANANLLEETTSMAHVYQRRRQLPQKYQQPYQQPQEVLHFKVVQTSHQEEFQQDFRQQQPVFTVKQSIDQYPQHDIPEQPGHEIKQRRSLRTPKGVSETIDASPELAASPQIHIESEIAEANRKPIAMRRRSSKRTESTTAHHANESTGSPLTTEKPKRENSKRNKELDYTTRCICEMTHNDPFMIQCDRCDVWQHGYCMGISESKVPDTYLCEGCNPRQLKITPKQAQLHQKRILTKEEAQKRKQKIIANIKRQTKAMSKKTAPFGIRKSKIVGKKTIRNFARKIGQKEESPPKSNNKNVYSRGVRSLMANKQPYVLGELGLLKRLEKTPPLTRQMLVAPNTHGLVATQGKTPLAPGLPIIEYTGEISLLSEVRNRSPNKSLRYDNTLIYSGLDGENKIFIDASKSGNFARVVRRSCRPNATIQHAIIDGQLRIYLYATTNIPYTTEITIPFDYDYTKFGESVDCACGQEYMDNLGENNCPVNAFNKSLQTQSSSGVISSAASPSSFPLQRTIRRQTSNFSGAKSPKDKELAIVKEELKTPERESRIRKAPQNIPSTEENRQLRARNTLKQEEPQPQHGRLTRRSTVSVTETEMKKKPKESPKTAKPFKATSSSYNDFIDQPSSSASIATSSKAARSDLATSANAYRQQSFSLSPKPKKRGRPPNATMANKAPKEPKSEPMEADDQQLSREERKIQATIASIERAEQMKEGKKRRQSEEQQKSFQTTPAKKTRVEKKQSGPSSKKQATKIKTEPESDVWEALCKAVQAREKSDFRLPTEYNKLRAQVPKDSEIKRKTKSPKKEEKISPIQSTSSIAARQATQTKFDSKNLFESAKQSTSSALEAGIAKGKPTKASPSVPTNAKQTERNESSVQQKLEADTQAEPEPEQRPPNTKAHKKLTLEEYKRKKMAEMEAKRAGKDSSGSQRIQPSHPTAASTPTRQSPRKSFIPPIGNMPSSPPQQLEEFVPSPPAIVGRQPVFSTPSLDELKRRMQWERTTGRSGNNSGEGTSSSSQHPPLPVDPHPPKSQEEKPKQSLDDRLKKFVSKRGT